MHATASSAVTKIVMQTDQLATLSLPPRVAFADANALTCLSIFENIAVLDPSAHLVAFIHMDNSYYGSIDMSQKKAKTVVLFNGQFPSHGLYNRTQPGPGNDLWSLQTSNDGLVVFPGGQPIYDHDGYFIGAVGVSGGTVEQDVDVAIHAAEAIGTTLKLDL